MIGIYIVVGLALLVVIAFLIDLKNKQVSGPTDEATKHQHHQDKINHHDPFH